MKVGVITSWNIKCGIAEYSKNLMNSLRKLGVEVEIYPIDEIRDLKTTFSHFERCDVLNLQYEHGLFRQSDLYDWATRFRSLVKHPKLFITVHQVLKGDMWDSLYDMLDGVIVHSDHFGAILRDKTFLIPHGCLVYEQVSIEEARRKLRLKDGPFLSTFGFMFPHKGWEYIIGAMSAIQREYPRCTLLMVCSHFRDKSKTKPTAKAMKKYAKKIKVNVKFFHDKWDPSEFMPLIQASDVFITSQEMDDRMIVSGSAMMGISARRPTITNDCSIYNQIKPYSYVVPRGSPDEISEAVLNLLSDKQLYGEYFHKAMEAYDRFNWDAIAKRHIDLYIEQLQMP